ncbi:MAG: hypothetical protein ACYSTJ_02055 [Planctomycetota bacterium]|jgi:hypothetical protein
MKVKGTILAALGVFFVLATSSRVAGVSTMEVDAVRNKGVLDELDLGIIDDFVVQGVQELVETLDFTSVSKIRTVLLSRSSSSRDSAAAQYESQFSDSARRYISEAFETASGLTPEDRRFKAILNLLILVDSLEDVRLADLALEWIRDDGEAIRFWAVHCVTSPGLVKQLNNPGDAVGSELAGRIAAELKGMVEGSSAEILALMVSFAGAVEIEAGEELLVQMADMRMREYADWTVEYQLLDGLILKALDAKMPSEEGGNPALARRFGQLYSYAIQRYVKGREILSDTQKERLASVLVEIEVFCIGKRLRMAQSVIKTAVEEDSYVTLLQEHSRLLGDETRAGQLPLKMNFDYGKNPDGSRRIAPLVLSEPPESGGDE